jgi:hypothetical protein
MGSANDSRRKFVIPGLYQDAHAHKETLGLEKNGEPRERLSSVCAVGL